MKRTISAEGDSASVVTRRATKYAAKATIRTEHGDELVLCVERDGSFALYQHRDSGAYNRAVPLITGQLGNPHTATGAWCTCEACE